MLKTAYALGAQDARRKLAAHEPGEDHPYVSRHREDTIAENAANMGAPLAVLGLLGGSSLGLKAGGTPGAVIGGLLGGGLGGYGGYNLGKSLGEDIHDASVRDILMSPASARRQVEGGLDAGAYGRVALHGLIGAGRRYDPDDEDSGTRALLRGGLNSAGALMREQRLLDRKRRLVEALVGLEEQGR